jgi:hypothetical protein
MRGMFSKFTAGFVVLVLAGLSQPLAAHACAVCYGDPDAPVSKGLSLAIFALVGVVLTVLGSLIAFFVYANRRAARIESETADPVFAGQN